MPGRRPAKYTANTEPEPVPEPEPEPVAHHCLNITIDISAVFLQDNITPPPGGWTPVPPLGGFNIAYSYLTCCAPSNAPVSDISSGIRHVPYPGSPTTPTTRPPSKIR